MAEPLFVISGATGHVGSVIAHQLLDQKKRVRVIGRNARKLAAFSDKGAEVAVGSLEDAAFVEKALSGATAVFAMIPPNYSVKDFRAYQNRIIDAFVRGIRAAKVPYVVSLSSIGGQLSEGNGPVAGLHDMEEKLNHLPGLNVLHLRPTYFLENQLGSISMIKAQNLFGGALRGDLAMPMIASHDIGEVGARRLGALDFKGSSVLELLGHQDLTMEQVAQEFGKAIGKPDLKYTQFPYDDAKKGMVGAGIPEEMAGLYMEMTRGFNEGRIKPTQARSPQTTTPTDVAAFAKTVFAPAFRAS